MADPEADEAVGVEERGYPEVPRCCSIALSRRENERQVLKHSLTGEEIGIMRKLPRDAMGLPRPPEGHTYAFKLTERVNVFTDVTSQAPPVNHVQVNVVDGKILFDDASGTLRRAPWLTLVGKLIGPDFDNDHGTPVDAVLLALCRAKGSRWD